MKINISDEQKTKLELYVDKLSRAYSELSRLNELRYLYISLLEEIWNNIKLSHPEAKLPSLFDETYTRLNITLTGNIIETKEEEG